MRQVIIVSLDNRAYHIEEEGYRALQNYLDRARRGLKNNPDTEEILGDLELAIAEKCAGVVNDTKNVVTTEDIARILQEMGPVDANAAEERQEPKKEDGGTKTLRRRAEGAAIAGVCSGLAEYFSIDVLIVRLAFVGLTLVSGAGIILYLIMALAVPGEDGPLFRERKFSKPVIGAVLVLLAIVAYVVLNSRMSNWGGHGGMLGLSEFLLILLLPVAFFGLIAVIAACLVIFVVKHLRTSQ